MQESDARKGFEKVVKTFLELAACSSPGAFSVCCDLFPEALIAAGQDTVYLSTADQGGAFHSENGVWSAPWRSSFFECDPGYSIFLPQVVEAMWKAEDVLHGSTKFSTTDRMFTNLSGTMESKHADHAFESIHHIPSGQHQHQGSLIRGDGIAEPVGGIHEEGFRKFTCNKLEALKAKRIDFMIELGVHGPFLKTFVFPSKPKAVFDEPSMENFLKLTFSTSPDEARTYHPRGAGQLSLGLYKQLFLDFVVVGQHPGGRLVDFSRSGMIKNCSEFMEFLSSQQGVGLGRLGGTPGARALERAAAKAEAKAKAKISAASKRRDAYVNAFASVFKRPPRSKGEVANVAEEAFGGAGPASSSQQDLPQHQSAASPPQEESHLEGDLSDLMEAESGNGPMVVGLDCQIVFDDIVPAIIESDGSDTETTLMKGVIAGCAVASATRLVSCQKVNI